MFRELDHLEGKRWTSYEKNESEALTHSSEGRTQKGCPMRLTSKCGNGNCTNAKKRYVQAYLNHAEHLQFATCYLQNYWATIAR